MARTAPVLWLDGKLVQTESATLPVMAHAAQRGSLVFDAGAWSALAGGGLGLFRVQEHVARFRESARIVGLEIGHSAEELVEAARAVVREAAPAGDGLVRWSVYFRAAQPDLLPRDPATHVAVAAQLLEDPPRQAPLAVATFADAVKASPSALPPTAKASAAYLGPMIARRRAVAAGADDVVLLDDEGNLAEAPIANVFAVLDGVLVTPPLGRILPGITRRSVLELARELGIPAREAPITRAGFQAADEAFLSGTSLPLAPIGVIDGRPLPAPGPITARLRQALLAARRGASAAHAAWLTRV